MKEWHLDPGFRRSSFTRQLHKSKCFMVNDHMNAIQNQKNLKLALPSKANKLIVRSSYF